MDLTLSNELLEAADRDQYDRAVELVNQGALPFHQDKDGWTSLHFAVLNDNQKLVKFLLDNGALWNIVDNNGFSAGDVAFSLNYNKIYKTILDYGVRVEMLQAVMSSQEDNEESNEGNRAFLNKKLVFEGSGDRERCLDEEHNVVMAGWETNIMKESAKLLCQDFANQPDYNLRILNIGFGLGIVDNEFQKYNPEMHVIVEPHADVVEHARSKGWLDRSNVHFVHSTWQEYVQKVESGEEQADFDVVYIDTFAEDYPALHEFFDHLPNLLAGPESKFSFFHGLGATQRLFYDVYTRVSELHLHEIGLETEWQEIEPEDFNELDWKGAKSRYWDVASLYRLPISQLSF